VSGALIRNVAFLRNEVRVRTLDPTKSSETKRSLPFLVQKNVLWKHFCAEIS